MSFSHALGVSYPFSHSLLLWLHLLLGIRSSHPDEIVRIRGELWDHLASQGGFLKYYPAIQIPFVVQPVCF